MINLLIADDQPAVLDAWRRYVATEPDIEIIGEACDGLAAVAVAARRRPHVVLMDIRMPRLDGLAAIRRITAGRDPVPSVLAVTTFDRDDYVFEALRAGAVGFLLKDSGPELCMDAVRLAHGGHGLIDPRVTRRLVHRFAAVSPRVPGEELGSLTPREHDVLVQLARGLSNVEIARALHIGPGTVKTHISHLLVKLRLRTRVQAVIYAYRHGVVPPDGNE